MSGADFDTRLASVRQAFTIGEVANALGLKGASRAGWECPSCHAPNALAERADHEGCRCTNGACGEGFSRLRLVMVTRGVSAHGGILW